MKLFSEGMSLASTILLVLGVVVSLATGNWDWLARFGCLIVACSIGFFAMSDRALLGYERGWHRAIDILHLSPDDQTREMSKGGSFKTKGSPEDWLRLREHFVSETKPILYWALAGTLLAGFGNVPNGW